MPLTARETHAPRKLVSEGLHPANCIGVVDLGTQESFGELKHQVLIIWELPSERYKFEREGQPLDLPRIITKTYNLTLSDKATLRHDLKCWRGQDFTADELKAFNIEKVLSAPCQLQVMHKLSVKGNPRAEICNVLPWPKGTPRQPIELAKYFFSFEGLAPNNPRIPDDVPDWIKKKIMAATEWQEITASSAPSSAPETSAPDDAAKDDFPF